MQMERRPGCEGKVAIVTGASGNGMGRSIALTLAREGASVVVNYRANRAAAEKVVEQIRRDGGAAVPMQADVLDPQGCQTLVAGCMATFGRVDICIIGPGGDWHPEPVDRLKTGAALSDVESEVGPVLSLLPLLLPGMYERGWGRIIGIGTHLGRPSPSYAYNLAKVSRMQALLMAADPAWPNGVTVNVIAPGPVRGIETVDEAAELCRGGEKWQARADVSPQDIAEGVAFLCSEAGRYITGCTLGYLFRG